MMPKEVLSAEEMEYELMAAQSKTVVVDFFAPWCGPCHWIAPKLEEFSMTYPNVVTLKVNVDDAMELVEKYEIVAMPTFLAIKEGNVVETIIGADIEKLEGIYKKHNGDGLHVSGSSNSSLVKGLEAVKSMKVMEVMEVVNTAAVTNSISPVDA